MFKNLKTVAFSFWILCLTSSAFGTEYVPVYMWETSRHTETIPALDRISEDSFKDLLLERLTKNPFVLIFAERNLSPEDFARHDSNGQTPFSGVSQLKSSAKVTYWPFVHSPIRAVKQLDKRISEIAAENLDGDLIVPADSDQILIVDLNDAKDDEDRLDMLKRHDEIIVKIYKKALEENDNVLALYTAHHTSWVVSEDIRSNRRARSLLATSDASNTTGLVYNTTEVLLYVDSSATYLNNTVVDDLQNYVASVTKGNNSVVLELTNTTAKDVAAIKFIIEYSAGYWYLSGINVTEKGDVYSLKVKDVYAPVGFSYHCTAGLFYGGSSTQNLSLPRFQIQAYSNTQNRTQAGFGDAYDCVGFTTAPIWSGLFVTFILALIMTFGLTFMMDIKTMDRFDDPKGKTITVNVAE